MTFTNRFSAAMTASANYAEAPSACACFTSNYNAIALIMDAVIAASIIIALITITLVVGLSVLLVVSLVLVVLLAVLLIMGEVNRRKRCRTA